MKKRVFAALAIIIVAIMIASYAVVGSKLVNSREWSGQYKVGSFLEYYSNSSQQGNEIERFTVTSVNGTTIYYDWTVICGESTDTRSGYLVLDPVSRQQDDLPFSIGMPVKGTLVFPGTADLVGTDDIMTKWGLRTCEHYNITSSNGNFSGEEWFCNGVVVKFIGTLNDINKTWSYELKDTNFEEITVP